MITSWYSEATIVPDLNGEPRPLIPEKQTADVTVDAGDFGRLPVAARRGRS